MIIVYVNLLALNVRSPRSPCLDNVLYTGPPILSLDFVPIRNNDNYATGESFRCISFD